MEKVIKVRGEAHGRPHPVTWTKCSQLSYTQQVLLQALTPPARPAPSDQLRSCAGAEKWQLEMVWGALSGLFSDKAAGNGTESHVQVGLWPSPQCASCCRYCNCRGGLIVLSSQRRADRSHSGIPVMSHYLSFNLTPRCFEHFDLLGIHFLACCVSLWKCFWQDLDLHFPVLLRWWGASLSSWPNKSDSCQGGVEKNWNWFQIPLFAVSGGPAALRSVFHPHGAAAKLRITSGGVGQRQTEVIHFHWHVTCCCVSDNSMSCGRASLDERLLNLAFRFHDDFFYSKMSLEMWHQRR